MNVQRDTNPVGIWITIAHQQWNEQEISLAKKALESVTILDIKKEIKGYTDRKGDSKPMSELKDIRDLLDLYTNKDCMPLIIATSEQVKEAPQFWGTPESQDMGTVVDEIKVLKNTISDYIIGNNNQMAEMRREMSSVMSVRQRTSNFLRQQTLTGSPSKRPRQEDQEQEQGDWSEEVVQEEQRREQEQSWADKAKFGAQVLGVKPLERQQQENTKQQNLRIFQNILMNKNTPSKPKKIFGSAKGDEENMKLAADVDLVAFGVRKDVTEDMMTDYLQSKNIGAKVKIMTRTEVMSEVRTISMRVSVKASQYEEAMKSEVWPYRVGVRLYDNRTERRERQARQEQGRSSGVGGGVATTPGAAGEAEGAAGGLPAGAEQQAGGWQYPKRRGGYGGGNFGRTQQSREQVRNKDFSEFMEMVAANLN